MRCLTELIDCNVPSTWARQRERNRVPTGLTDPEFNRATRTCENILRKALVSSQAMSSSKVGALTAANQTAIRYVEDTGAFAKGLVRLNLERLLESGKADGVAVLAHDWNAIRNEAKGFGGEQRRTPNEFWSVDLVGHISAELQEDVNQIGESESSYDLPCTNELTYLLETLYLLHKNQWKHHNVKFWASSWLGVDEELGYAPLRPMRVPNSVSLFNTKDEVLSLWDLIAEMYRFRATPNDVLESFDDVDDRQLTPEHDKVTQSLLILGGRHRAKLEAFGKARQRVADIVSLISERLKLYGAAMNDTFAGDAPNMSGQAREVVLQSPLLWTIFDLSRALDVDGLVLLRSTFSRRGDTDELSTQLAVSTLSPDELRGVEDLVSLLIHHIGLVRGSKATVEFAEANRLQSMRMSISKTEHSKGSVLQSPIMRLLVSLVDSKFPQITIYEWPSVALFNALRLKNRPRSMLGRYLATFFGPQSAGEVDGLPVSFQSCGLVDDVISGWSWYRLLRSSRTELTTSQSDELFATLRAVVREAVSDGLPSMQGLTSMRPCSYVSHMAVLGGVGTAMAQVMDHVPVLRRLFLIISRYVEAMQCLSGQDPLPSPNGFSNFVDNFGVNLGFKLRLVLIAAKGGSTESRLADMSGAICERMNSTFLQHGGRYDSMWKGVQGSAEQLAGGLNEIQVIMNEVETEFDSLAHLLEGPASLRANILVLYRNWGERLRREGRLIAALSCFMTNGDHLAAAEVLAECLANPVIFAPRVPSVLDEVIVTARRYIWITLDAVRSNEADALQRGYRRLLGRLALAAQAFERFHEIREEEALVAMEAHDLIPLTLEALSDWNSINPTLGLRLLELYTQALYGSYKKATRSSETQRTHLKRRAAEIITLCQRMPFREGLPPVVEEIVRSITAKATLIHGALS